jgi:hypothetical protein
MATCVDEAAAEDAKQILTYLSKNNQNVVQMAEANHFKPLVHCLIEGASPHIFTLWLANVLDPDNLFLVKTSEWTLILLLFSQVLPNSHYSTKFSFTTPMLDQTI